MKYKIDLTEEDYVRFNIFYMAHSKAGKRGVNMARIVFPALAAVILMAFFAAGAEPGLIAVEAVLFAAAAGGWLLYAPKAVERGIRKQISRMKADGKLPFHQNAEIEFGDVAIVEKNEQEEIRVNYQDIENVYPDSGYLYIFYSAVQAFIVPYRCLGEDRERVTEYIVNKKKIS